MNIIFKNKQQPQSESRKLRQKTEHASTNTVGCFSFFFSIRDESDSTMRCIKYRAATKAAAATAAAHMKSIQNILNDNKKENVSY